MSNEKNIRQEEVYNQLKEFLLNSDIYPGQKILHGELGAKLGIGITPLREAFFQLTAEGLLAHEKNKGFYVPEITAVEANELYEIRLLIEPYMAAKVAETITDEQMELVRKLVDLYKPDYSAEYNRRRLQIDREFHKTIMDMANNKRLANIIHQAYDQMVIRRKLQFLPLQRQKDAYRDHMKIYKALEQKDPKGVSRAMVSHIKKARKVVLADLTNRQQTFDSELSQ